MTSEFTAYNALLLEKTLRDRDVPDDVILSVFNNIEKLGITYNIEKDALSQVFQANNIQDLTEHTFQELKSDGPVLPYGSIACP